MIRQKEAGVWKLSLQQHRLEFMRDIMGSHEGTSTRRITKPDFQQRAFHLEALSGIPINLYGGRVKAQKAKDQREGQLEARHMYTEGKPKLS